MKKFICIIASLLCLMALSACQKSSNSDTDKSHAQIEKINKQAKEDLKYQTELAKAELLCKAKESKEVLIRNLVIKADGVMKNAETNQTRENLDKAKAAVATIPDGNTDLQHRVELVENAINAKEQQEASAQQPDYTSPEQQPGESDAEYQQRVDRIAAEMDKQQDAEYYASLSPEERQSQQNVLNGTDPSGEPLLPGQDHAAGADVYGNPDSWVQGQIDWAKQNGYLNEDGTPTEKEIQAEKDVASDAQ